MNEEERESSKNLRRLGPAFAFLKPYKWQVIIASVASNCDRQRHPVSRVKGFAWS